MAAGGLEAAMRSMGKMSIVGGLLLGLAVVIADALFQCGWNANDPNRSAEQARSFRPHAGDDSDGKMWGIEGINILFIVGRTPIECQPFAPCSSGGTRTRRHSPSVWARSPSCSPAFTSSRFGREGLVPTTPIFSRHFSKRQSVAAVASPATPSDSSQ